MDLKLILLVLTGVMLALPVESYYKTVPVAKKIYLRTLARHRPYRMGLLPSGVLYGRRNFRRIHPVRIYRRKHFGRRRIKPISIGHHAVLSSRPRFVSKISRQLSRLPYIPPLRCPKSKIMTCSEYKHGEFKRLCFGKCHGKPCIKACGCFCIRRKRVYPKNIVQQSGLLPVNRKSLIPYCRAKQVLRCTARLYYLSTSSLQCAHACTQGVCPTSCNCQCIAESHVGVGLPRDLLNENGGGGGGGGVGGVGGFVGVGGLVGDGGFVGADVSVPRVGVGFNGLLQGVGLDPHDFNSLDRLGLSVVDAPGLDINGLGLGAGDIGLAAGGLGIGAGSVGLDVGSFDAPDLGVPSLDVPDLSLPSLDVPGLGLETDPLLDLPSIDGAVGVALADGFVGVGNGVIGLAGGGKRKPSGKKEITETVDVKINVTTNGGKKGKGKGGGAGHGGAPGVFPNGRKVGLIAGGGKESVFISDPTQPKQLPGEPIPLIPGSGTQAVGLNNGLGGGGQGGADPFLNGLGVDPATLGGVDAIGGIPLNAQGQGPALPNAGLGFDQLGLGPDGIGSLPADLGLGTNGGGGLIADLGLGAGGSGGLPADLGLGAGGGGGLQTNFGFGQNGGGGLPSDIGLGHGGGNGLQADFGLGQNNGGLPADLGLGHGGGAGLSTDLGLGQHGGGLPADIGLGGHGDIGLGHNGGGHANDLGLNGHNGGGGGGGGGHDGGGGGGGHGGGHSGNQGEINEAVCRQAGAKMWCDVHTEWQSTPGLVQWCNTNCPSGNCDHKRCHCSCVDPNVYDANLLRMSSFK